MTPPQHVALIVEDDPAMAADVIEIVQALGHGHVITDCLEGGLELLGKGGLCYGIFDLEIKKSADSIKGHVDMGKALFDAARKKIYPGRAADDTHYWQILMMSYYKDHGMVVRMLRDGADAFIRKPLPDNPTSPGEEILEALKRSGRISHDRCAEMTRKAARGGRKKTAQGAPAIVINPSGIGGPASEPSLVITDRWDGRCWILVNGLPVSLSPKPFVMVSRLALARKADLNHGYVYKTVLDAAATASWNATRRLYKLLEAAGIPRGLLIENDSRGNFRIRFEPHQITVLEPAVLARHACEEVQKAFSKLETARP